MAVKASVTQHGRDIEPPPPPPPSTPASPRQGVGGGWGGVGSVAPLLQQFCGERKRKDSFQLGSRSLGGRKNDRFFFLKSHRYPKLRWAGGWAEAGVRGCRGRRWGGGGGSGEGLEGVPMHFT